MKSILLWILAGGIGLGVTIFLAVWYWLAPTNRFFTFVKEGTAKVVVKGDAFQRILIQWKGHTLSKEIKLGEDKDKVIVILQDIDDVIEGKEPWHPFGGFRYYGFWPIKDIYIYKFQWTGVTEDDRIVTHPKETLDYILLKDDVYYFEVEKAEDKNLLPLAIELNITIRIVNPYKALFRVQSWLGNVINRMKPLIRDIIATDEYSNWINIKEELGKKIFEQAETSQLLQEFRFRYGVDVRKIQVKDINPPANYLEKTLAAYLAEMGKKATIITAEGESQRIDKVFSTIQKFGDLGKLIRALEATEKSPLAASLSVQAIPGLSEVLRGVFGKSPETITREEINEILEAIRKKA